MPELPEVESTAVSLRRDLLGLKVRDLEVFWERMVTPWNPAELKQALKGAEIAGIHRRAKYLILELRRGRNTQYLSIHLRMSGRLRVENRSTPRDDYDRIILALSGQKELRFRDVRKFGRFTLLGKKEYQELQERLGPEPLSSDYNSLALYRALTKRSRAVKALLLDQSVVAGLGNIYVDESLWSSGIHPLRSGCSLKKKEVERLFRSMRRILKKAIECNGTDFGDGVVLYGAFDPQVYGRDGEECRRCKGVLRRIIVAQRGTVVCERCQ